MARWYQVHAPPRTRDSLPSGNDGMSWRVLVVEGRVAACSSYPAGPVQIGEAWQELTERWRRWGEWRVEPIV